MASYELQLDDNSEFSSPESFTVAGTTSIYTMSTGLADGLYYWRVRVKDTAGVFGNWSETWSVTVDSTPELLSPATGSTTNDATPTFDWSDMPAVAYYQLHVDDNAELSSPQIVWLTASTYTMSPALADGIYYWRVRVKDTAGVFGNWSQTWSVVIIAALQPLMPQSPLMSQSSMMLQSLQFWPDVPLVDRSTTFDFGSHIDFESTVITRAYLLGFFTYQGEEVPAESTCMGGVMPGRGSEGFWSTGTLTELAPGVNSFEQSYVYDQPAPDDATHLILWLMFRDAGDQMLTCWQKVIELSPLSP